MFRREERRRSRFRVSIPQLWNTVHSPERRARLARQTRQTLWHIADQMTRALTAGVGLDDWGTLWRNTPPHDPEVYARAMSRVFWTHLRPRVYYQSALKITHTLGFGFLSVLFAFIQLVTGTLMMFFYEPSPARAYASVVHLTTQVPLGWLLRNVHHLSAHLLVLFVILHLLRVYFTGAFKQQRRLTWVTGVLLLALVLLIALFGYRLPMDSRVTWGNPDDVLLYYLLHTGILPGAALLLVGAHYYRVARLHGISLPASEEESPDPYVQAQARTPVAYFPYVWAREVMWITGALLIVLVLAAFVVHIPLAPPFDAERVVDSVPWFFLWWRGWVHLPALVTTWLGQPIEADMVGWGWALAILLLVLLLAVPYLDALWDKALNRTPSRLGSNRKLSIALGLGTLALFAVLSFVGTVSLHPSEIAWAQEFLTDTCAPAIVPLLPPDCGEVRRIGYEDLPIGTFELARYTTPSTDRFEQMLFKMQTRLQTYADLAEAQGVLSIEEWQTDLKKITLRLRWTPRAPDPNGYFEKVIYLHRDSRYEW